MFLIGTLTRDFIFYCILIFIEASIFMVLLFSPFVKRRNDVLQNEVYSFVRSFVLDIHFNFVCIYSNLPMWCVCCVQNLYFLEYK